jgi:hypothetical protein
MASWVTDIFDIIEKKFKFWEEVFEYHHALKFRLGRAVASKAYLKKEELEEVVKKEKALIQESGGYSKFVLPFKNPKIPGEYRRSFFSGLPKHPDRFEVRGLRPGLYLFVPFFESIFLDFKQERILNLGNISVPTTDEVSKTKTISCNLRYEIDDYYKAYTRIHDYELSLKSHTLSVLAKYSRGKTDKQWKDPNVIEELETKTLEELADIAKSRWGLKIFDIYITDNVDSSFQRVFYEGTPLTPSDTVPQTSSQASI